MNKRTYGHGAIYHRADGRWEGQFRIKDGGRRSFYGRTRQEVLRKLEEAAWMIASQLPVSSRTPTLGQFLEGWLDVAKRRVRPSTCDNYSLNVRRLDEQLGLIRITSLSPQIIQDAYRRLQDGGLTAYSVLQTHRTLSRALTQAFHWGVIPRNPATLVFPPRPRKREATALTPQELLRLFEHTRADRLRAMWVLLGTSGLRLGEALGLAWDDVDLVAGRLVVRRTLQRRRRAGLVFGTPKTPTSRRTVLLCGLAVQALRVHRSRQGQLRAAADNWCDSGLVFTNTTGGPLEPSFALHDLHRSLDRAGLPRIRVHDLRHTTASLLLVAEVHPKIVQDMLGHSTVLTTLDTYSHVMPTLQAEAIRRLDFLLAGIQLPTGPPSADTIGTSRPVAA